MSNEEKKEQRNGLTTIEEVRAAEKEMKRCQEALRAYLDNQADGRNIRLNLRLATDLKNATDKYFALVLGLNSK
jgi:hypothetical protein